MEDESEKNHLECHAERQTDEVTHNKSESPKENWANGEKIIFKEIIDENLVHWWERRIMIFRIHKLNLCIDTLQWNDNRREDL